MGAQEPAISALSTALWRLIPETEAMLDFCSHQRHCPVDFQWSPVTLTVPAAKI